MQRETREFLAFCATVLAVGLAVVWCSATGLATLSGSPAVAGRFEAWGLPGWVGGALGAIEAICALALLIPRANYFAALALIGMAVLQIAMAARHGQPPWFELAGLQTLALLVYLFRPGRMNRLLAEDPDQLS